MYQDITCQCYLTLSDSKIDSLFESFFEETDTDDNWEVEDVEDMGPELRVVNEPVLPMVDE